MSYILNTIRLVKESNTDIICLPYKIFNCLFPDSDVIPIFHKINDEYIRITSHILNNSNPNYVIEINGKKYIIRQQDQVLPVRNFHRIVDNPIIRKIPRIIIQTWDTKNIDNCDLGFAKKVICEMNPEYEYRLIDETERREFIQQNFGRRVLAAYDKLRPTAYKCDLWRYCYLYIHGGIYIDIKTSTTLPLYSILDQDYELLLVIEHEGKGIFNGVMGAPPNHQYIGLLIDYCVESIENEFYGDTALDITGPNLCSEVFNIYKNKVDFKEVIKEEYHEYRYLELAQNDEIIDNKNHKIKVMNRVFSTYYSKYNNTDSPNRFWNAWKNRTVYN